MRDVERVKSKDGGPDIIVEDWGEYVKIKTPIFFKKDYAYQWLKTTHERAGAIIERYKSGPREYVEYDSDDVEVLEFL